MLAHQVWAIANCCDCPLRKYIVLASALLDISKKRMCRWEIRADAMGNLLCDGISVDRQLAAALLDHTYPGDPLWVGSLKGRPVWFGQACERSRIGIVPFHQVRQISPEGRAQLWTLFHKSHPAPKWEARWLGE